MEPVKYFGGVEGGATHSNLVVCDGGGRVLGAAKGAGTNHWAIGIDECAARILAMLARAKDEAGLPRDTPLDCLGLTLSGCEQESSNAELAARVREKDPNCAREIYVASDTMGSLYTGAPGGGMVLIAGTGSNALLVSADGTRRGCGGWGHLLGDEGGAWWVTRLGVKYVLDAADGLRPAPHDTAALWKVLRRHFRAETTLDLLPHAYQHFDKSHFAGACEQIAALARAGDALAAHLMAACGAALAAHVAALVPHAESGAASNGHGGGGGDDVTGDDVTDDVPADVTALRVVCVGSLWRSWDLLRGGFLQELRRRAVRRRLALLRLRVPAARGAAWLAARCVGHALPRHPEPWAAALDEYTPATPAAPQPAPALPCGCEAVAMY